MDRQDDFRCNRCREVIRLEDRFCEACGAPIEEPDGHAAGPTGTPSSLAGAEAGSAPDERDHLEVAFEDMAGISDRGLRRARNEDALALARVDGPGARVMVVCDGVSTSAQPAKAAQAAAEATLRHLVAALGLGHSNHEQAMKEAVNVAQSAVCRVPYEPDGEGPARPGGEGPVEDQGPPATTLVAAMLLNGRVTLGWVGDSRAYFVGPGEAWQLSHDDTWLEEVVQPHLVGEGGAAVALRAHVLTRWLGSDQEGEPEVSITTFLLPAEGILLLCSDGLWNYAPTPSQIRELVSGLGAGSTPLELTRGLVEFARGAGGADNVTVAVATV
jgi:serine/threonine protein phosphatase PrpC